ncbi:hypothetical protein [Mumia sp. DW29H23]|uniref:hypothetical protein n=1 Tax=Mumia sp. DW29H23 TaxID=3421241 RepID=UPI003D69E73B
MITLVASKAAASDPTVSWELVVAVGAFLLSFYAASREWRERRQAAIEVRWERVPAPDGGRSPHSFLVIANHGPATAKNVSAIPKGANGRPVDLVSPDLLPLAELHPGQDFHLQVTVILNVGFRSVELGWKDHRWRRQRRTVVVSPRAY